jgi:hypothetical protein
MDHISLEQKTLLSLLGHHLFSAPFVQDSAVDWEKVAKEARAHTVFSIAFNQYKQLPLGDELSAKVKTTLMKYALSNTACYKNHTYLHELMQKHNISYCALKGAVSASYYPDPFLRSMGDVDFYVHPDDIDKALQVFQHEGFVRDEMNHPCHISMKNGSKHFEMHFKPVAYREGPIGEKLEEYWGDIRETAVLNESNLATYYGPSIFHHGFILLTHLQHHLFYEGVGLRHFCDWVLFADSLSNDDFVSVFESKLKQIGLYRLAQLLSLGAVKHMGMAHKDWMGDDYNTADELLADIIYGGNFGRKDKQRAYEGLFIYDRNTGDMNKGRLRQFFGSLNNMVDYHWKSAKKCTILYPIGWAYFSLRYLIRVMLGKRKMNLVDTYRKSGQRREKYSKIRVFEREK